MRRAMGKKPEKEAIAKMRYLFNMGLSGSVLTVAYMLGKCLSRGRLDPKWRCLATRGILLYYLIPLTFLKKIFYRWRKPNAKQIAYVDSSKSLLLYSNGKKYLNGVFQRELLLGGIWILVAAGVFLLMFRRYRKAKRLFDCSGGVAAVRSEEAEFEEIRRDRGIRRKVRYLDSMPADGTGKTAFTVGVWNPVIVYPADRKDLERQLIVEHELTHIKHGDLLWQMLTSMACILHCVNPFVWYLKGEMAQVAELYCDRTLLQDKDAETGLVYAKLLLEMADGNGRKGWRATLSGSGKRLKERLDGIVKPPKYLGNVVSAAVVVLAVLLNSLTVLAYQDVQVWTSNVDDIEREKFLHSEMEFEFAPIGMYEESRFSKSFEIEFLYDYQFMDAEGNIYPISGEEMLQTNAACNHQYAQGKYSTHERNDNGGCTLTFYEADRCALCGDIIIGDRRYYVQWDPCPHQLSE